MRRFLPAFALVALAGCAGATAHQAIGHQTPSRVPDPRPTRSARPTPLTPTAAATTTPTATPRPPVPVRPVNAPATQRVIIAGDSIPEDLGPMITSSLAGPRFQGHTESHASSGLVRDDFFDWPAAARGIAAERPDTVILLMGGNDNQPITAPNMPNALPATPRWQAEYARRAGLVLDALHTGGVRQVYWLTMPTTTRSNMNPAVASMGQAVHLASKGRPGVTVYDTDVLLGLNAGTPLAHQPDGIHLSTLGSQLVANALIGRLRADAASQT